MTAVVHGCFKNISIPRSSLNLADEFNQPGSLLSSYHFHKKSFGSLAHNKQLTRYGSLCSTDNFLHNLAIALYLFVQSEMTRLNQFPLTLTTKTVAS